MVKITRETNSTTVEAIEHTIAVTFGLQASVTVTKGYCVSQDSSGNITHSVANDSMGTFVGVMDETVTDSVGAGSTIARVISHGFVYVTTSAAAITIGQPVKISATAGTISAATYGVDREDRILGTAFSAVGAGGGTVLLRLK